MLRILALLSIAEPSSADRDTLRTPSLEADHREWAEVSGLVGPRIANLSYEDSVRDVLSDTTRRRGRAIELSNGYATRLKLHQIGAFAMLPLVAGEFVMGQRLLNNPERPSGLRNLHQATAYAIYGVFGANTITGALNWWETRKDPAGRTRRTIHSLLLLAADVGYALTASAASGARRDLTDARTHRNLAEVSISVGLVGSALMWLWKK
jgi:hypothetical protein